jgi:6-phosphogluconolactonase
MRFFSFLTILAGSAAVWGANGGYMVYAGTYTGHGSRGIYAWRFDPATGKAQEIGLVAETENPSFLAIHPSGKYVYAVNEVDKGKGAVTAFAIDASTGKLTKLNTVSSGGSGPCHLAVDRSGRALVTANYGNGSVGLISLRGDGTLGELVSRDQHTGTGPDKDRQEGPHAHSINFTPDGHFAVGADLGTDSLYVYHFDASGPELKRDDALTAKTAPGAGPRHFAFHPNGRYGYVINEMGSTVTGYSYDGNGHLKMLDSVSTLPSGFHGENSTAEVVVHPNGHTLYGSNRGHDSIAVFSIDTATGKLTPHGQVPTGGKEPRNFALDPTGQYLFAANQNSNTIVIFRVGADGGLQPAGQVLSCVSPVCVRFVPR